MPGKNLFLCFLAIVMVVTFPACQTTEKMPRIMYTHRYTGDCVLYLGSQRRICNENFGRSFASDSQVIFAWAESESGTTASSIVILARFSVSIDAPPPEIGINAYIVRGKIEDHEIKRGTCVFQNDFADHPKTECPGNIDLGNRQENFRIVYVAKNRLE
jgi:hypothetical protein